MPCNRSKHSAPLTISNLSAIQLSLLSFRLLNELSAKVEPGIEDFWLPRPTKINDEEERIPFPLIPVPHITFVVQQQQSNSSTDHVYQWRRQCHIKRTLLWEYGFYQFFGPVHTDRRIHRRGNSPMHGHGGRMWLSLRRCSPGSYGFDRIRCHWRMCEWMCQYLARFSSSSLFGHVILFFHE